MNLRAWFQRGLQRRLEAAQPDDAANALREFVYLDETSVTSLVASKKGAVAELYVADRSDSMRAELESAIEGGAPGIGKGKVGGRAVTERVSASQITRRAVIQSTFKELREAADHALLMEAGQVERPASQRPVTFEQMQFMLANSAAVPWAVDVSSLQRGCLLEIDVDLDVEPRFQAQTAIDAMVEVVVSNPGLFDDIDSSVLNQVRGIQRILTYLLGDLVPIEGVATDWMVTSLPEGKWLVRRSVVEQVGAEALAVSSPLTVVGVADASLFWKDIRRILFDSSRFTVYCRVGRPGIQETWQPVKLLGVLHNVAPSVARSLERGVTEFFEAFRSGLSDLEQDGVGSPDKWDSAADDYVFRLRGSAPVGDIRAGRSISIPRLFEAGDANEFERGVEWLEKVGREHDDEGSGTGTRATEIREDVLRQHGLLADAGAPSVTPLGGDERKVASEHTTALLDVEIIAIYW